VVLHVLFWTGFAVRLQKNKSSVLDQKYNILNRFIEHSTANRAEGR